MLDCWLQHDCELSVVWSAEHEASHAFSLSSRLLSTSMTPSLLPLQHSVRWDCVSGALLLVSTETQPFDGIPLETTREGREKGSTRARGGKTEGKTNSER